MATKMETEQRYVVDEAPHCKVYNDGTIMIGPVRCSYPHLFEAYQGEQSEKPKYSMVGLMPFGAEYRGAKNLLVKFIDEMIRSNKQKAIPAGNKFLRDGNLTGKDENENMFTINASEAVTRRPILRDSKRDPKTGKPRRLDPATDADVIYGGCWVNMLIRPWWMNNKHGKKVNASLIAVQKVRDDEAFGQGRVSEDDVDDEFETYDDEDGGFEDDDLGDEL